MLRKFFKKYGWRYIPGAILMVVCAYISTRAPLALGKAADLAVKGDWNAFIKPCLDIFWIALLVFITRFGWRWFVVRTSREMEVYLRDELFTHLMFLPSDFFHKTRSGDLMAYAINDVNAVRMMFGIVVAQFINSLSSLMFSVGSMSTGIHTKLTVFSLLPVPVAIITVVLLGNLIRRRAKYSQEMFSKLSGHVQENINGMRVIKAFAQEKPQYKDYELESDEKRRANLKLYYTSALMDPIIKSVFGISFAVGLIYGGRLVEEGIITLDKYIAFNSYLTMIVNPIVMIGRINNNLQRGLASHKRLKTLMDETEIPPFDRVNDGRPIIGKIEAKGLTYKYLTKPAPSLVDVDFTIEAGKMLGIVGPTGCGKTSIISLVTKLMQPNAGQLFIDGTDITEIPAAALRAHIGYVPQDGFLFDESIRENVRFFSDATDEEITSVLDIAGMTGDIAGMPEGLETMCGERGNHLSGGQRQRVSLARALVRKPEILLLDDTLSAVDAETEEKILYNLKHELKGKTCIVIAHRLSAVRNADEIIYMDKGRVMERGTHEELLARNGLYAAMYAEQCKK